jgi:hypothetical protein
MPRGFAVVLSTSFLLACNPLESGIRTARPSERAVCWGTTVSAGRSTVVFNPRRTGGAHGHCGEHRTRLTCTAERQGQLLLVELAGHVATGILCDGDNDYDSIPCSLDGLEAGRYTIVVDGREVELLLPCDGESDSDSRCPACSFPGVSDAGA